MQRQAPDHRCARTVRVDDIWLEERVLPGLQRGFEPPDMVNVLVRVANRVSGKARAQHRDKWVGDDHGDDEVEQVSQQVGT